jgi:hypothetical protein
MLELVSELIKEKVNYFGADKGTPSVRALNGILNMFGLHFILNYSEYKGTLTYCVISFSHANHYCVLTLDMVKRQKR